MVKTNPRLYRQYAVLEKRRSVLYLGLQKALYGMMKSAFFFTRSWWENCKVWGLK